MSDSYASLLSQSSAVRNVQSLARRPETPRKRKWTENEESVLEDTFITILPETTSSTSQSLRCLCIVNRAQLPLSFLDPSTLLCKRLKAVIQFTERLNGQAAVLITQDQAGVLYALERIQDSQYAVCKLAPHVTLQRIRSLRHDVIIKPCRDGQSWRDAAVIDINQTPGHERARKTLRLAMIPVSKLAKIASREEDETRASELDQQAVTERPSTPPAVTFDDHEQDPQEAFAGFIQQYLDLLYKSRTSVAYLAKAHLSRLRAVPLLADETGKQRLIDFLESLILSSSTHDKKHKKVWHDKLQDVGPALSTEILTKDHIDVSRSKRTGRGKPKLKPNKQGLLPEEGNFFLHWWVQGDDSALSSELLDARYKRRSVSLRTREAFLQIILMLEVMSLRSALPAAEQEAQTSKQAPNKPKDRGLALELLLDKLCIWHSIEHGGLLGSSSADQADDSKKAPDHLRNFCVEVVVPFYMSRVPEQSMIVNKKLGGPVAPSPNARHTTHVTETNKSNNDRKDALKRVPSEKQTRSSRGVAGLTRSATDSQLIPGLKREYREMSLDSMSVISANDSTARRSSALDKMKLRQREVDFDALSQAQEVRRKKQADVESKLKEAINALKKPNRALAGREMADVTEQRERMAQAREKALKAQKARQRSSVQVDATPKHNRIRTDIVVTPEARRHTEAVTGASASSASIIPSSGMFQQRLDDHPIDTGVPQTGHRPHHQAVQATPMQPIKFTLPAIPTGGTSCERHRHPAIFETPVRAARQEQSLVEKTPIQETPRGGNENANIYDVLGWND